MLGLLNIAFNSLQKSRGFFLLCLWKPEKNGLLLLASITMETVELLTFHLVICVWCCFGLLFLRSVFIGNVFSHNIMFEEHCS